MTDYRSRRTLFRAGLGAVLTGLLLLAACAPAAAPAPAASGAGAPSASGAPATGSAASSAPAVPTAPRQPVKVTASFSELVTTQLPVWLTKEAGLFEKHGLDVDLQLMESTTGLPALLAGQVQIAQLGGGPVLAAAANGTDVVVLANLGPVYPYVFQVQPSIRSVDDLRGKTVGVSRMGSASDIATRLVLRKVGLEPDRDVTIIQVGSATSRTAALISGAIQGGIAQPPESLRLEAEGFVNLFDLTALNLPAASFVITAQRPWVQANRDVVQRYVDALVEGIARQRQDRALTLAVMKQYMKSDDEQTLGAAYDYYTQNVLPPLPYPRVEHFGDALAQLAESNEAVRGFDVASMLDPSFVQSAADRGLAGR